MIRFIYFDLGNTVVDYHQGPITEEEKEELGLELVSKQLREWGFPVSWEKLRKKFWEPWKNDIFRRKYPAAGEADAEDYLSRAVGSDSPDYPALIDLFHEPSRRCARAGGDIVEFMGELEKRGRGAGIISNTPIHGDCHDKTLARLGLLKHFSHRLYSYDEGVRKPYVEIFRRAREKTGLEWRDLLMVGNSFRADVQVPLSLGMNALLYDPKGYFGGAPCRRISRFGEIANYLD